MFKDIKHYDHGEFPALKANFREMTAKHLVPGGCPLIVDMREVVNAILYLNRAGCSWRLLPHDFPPWGTVHYYYRQWRINGNWQRIHDSLRDRLRRQEGSKTSRSAATIDSQSVKRDEGLKAFEVLPHRWIVEHTFARLGCYRRLSKDYEYLPQKSENMIYISMINLMAHRLQPERNDLK